MRDKTLLRQLQALPLDAKVLMSQQRIREWYNYFNGNVCISFSGGKDSTVLVHLVHDMYPNVPLVFANTGLEYPEIQAFARDMGAEFVRPKMNFIEVVTRYGYPIISKEVAEAISFARRIVSIGGVQHRKQRDFKRIELRGLRLPGEGRNWKANERTSLSRNQRPDRMEKGQPHRENATPPPTKEERNSNGRDNRELRRIQRFRKQLMGKD